MSALWMKVSSDEYELPEAVADSASALAEMVGVKANSVRVGNNRAKSGMCKTRYVKVTLDDDLEDDEEDWSDEEWD